MSTYKKIKGNGFEKQVLEKLRANNIKAQRVVASGSVVEDSGDIIMQFHGTDYNLECKFHKSLPTKKMEDWLDGNDILIMKENYGNPKVYMDLDILIGLLVSTRNNIK